MIYENKLKFLQKSIVTPKLKEILKYFEQFLVDFKKYYNISKENCKKLLLLRRNLRKEYEKHPKNAENINDSNKNKQNFNKNHE